MSSNFNMDALLDGTLEDLADKPEFKPFPVGTHRCTVKFLRKTVAGYPAMEFAIKAIETVELKNPEDSPVKAGDETSTLLFMDHEKETVWQLGQGQFKDILSAAANHFGAKANSALLEDINGAEALIVTNVRENKKNGQKYTEVVAVQFI